MGAARYFTPPPQLTSLRAFFDKYPEIVRRAYYSMGNYIVARDIINECQTRPVIMDRYYLFNVLHVFHFNLAQNLYLSMKLVMWSGSWNISVSFHCLEFVSLVPVKFENV